MRRASSALRGGKKRSCPPPSTPIVGAPGGQGARVGGRIDPEREARDDADAGRAEVAREPAGAAGVRPRDGARVPTTATVGAARAVSSPATQRPASAEPGQPPEGRRGEVVAGQEAPDRVLHAAVHDGPLVRKGQESARCLGISRPEPGRTYGTRPGRH